MINYGFMLQDGDGIPVDKKEAARYFRMADDKRNKSPWIQYNTFQQVRLLKLKMFKENSINSMYRCAIMLYEWDE